MEKTRNIKTLLELMLNNKECFSTGLCLWCNNIYLRHLINWYERESLLFYIKNNRPKYNPFDIYMLLYYNNNSFYWSPKKIKPRIKWIEKHIKLLENTIQDNT